MTLTPSFHHQTQGAFLHRDYLQLYTAGMPPGVHEYVDAQRNCEDIAMAFLVANVTGTPPEYVRAPSLRDLGQGVFKVPHLRSRTCPGLGDTVSQSLTASCQNGPQRWWR